MDTHELACAAGFFNGEGSTGLHKDHGVRRRLEMTVGQSNSDETLQQMRRALEDGRIGGPYHYSGRAPLFRFVIQGFDRTTDAVAKLWPWLSITKREQAARAITAALRHHVMHGRLQGRKRAHNVH